MYLRVIQWILPCLLLTLSTIAYGQLSLRGKVTDATNTTRIGFATVYLLTPRDSIIVKMEIADSLGEFSFSNIPAGNYVLFFSAIRYRQLYLPIALVKGNAQALDLGAILLHPDTQQLNEVIVTNSRPAIQRTADKLIVTIAGNRLFRAAGNGLDILRKVPGVEVSAEGVLQLSGRITPAVFIDGKPSPMSPEELYNYLSGLSPDMIASIEVIANPSARYDGEFKGIINIQLKRDSTLGWRGNISSAVQQNEYRLAENNLLLTYKTPALTYTARVGYTTGTRVYRYNALQHLANTNILSTNTQIATRHNNYNFQSGANYQVAAHQQIEVLVRTYQQQRDIASYNTLHTTDASETNNISDTYTHNQSAPGQHNYAANLNYSGTFGNTQLQVISSLLTIGNRQQEDIQTKNAPTHDLLTYWKTALQNDITIRTVQADLSGAIGKGKWNAGGRFAHTTTDNDIRYDTLHTAGLFVVDSSRTNRFLYNEYIAAAYSGYEGKWKQWQYIASLRAEHTHTIARAVYEVTKRTYLNWLPSLVLTYTFNENKQLNLSFTRRMTRPNFIQLNPFRTYNSPLNYVVGNPYLLPSKTSTLSIAYSQKAFTATISAGREKDPLARYPEYDSATNILEYLGRNLPYNDFANIETSFPLSLTAWWRTSHTIGGYYIKEQTPYHNTVYTIPIFSYTLTGSQVFTLPKGLTADLSYYYRSRGGNGLYIARPMYNVDLGLQKSWIQGKLNTKVNFYDMFDTWKVRYIFREKTIIDNQLNHWFGVQRITFTINYSFGKSTHKARQNNKNEEENRAL